MRQVAGLHVYAWPTGKVVPPAAVVSYPTEIDYLEGRGLHRMSLPLVIVFGRPVDPATRDTLAAYANGGGPKAVAALVDAYAWTACDSVTCKRGEVDVVQVGAVGYLAGLFTLDIIGLQ